MKHFTSLSVTTISYTLLVILSLLCVFPLAAAESGTKDYSAGRASEQEGDMIAAYIAYKRALSSKPADLRYRSAYERVRGSAASEYVKRGEDLVRKGNLAAGLSAFLKALDIDAANEVAETDIHMVEERLKRGDAASDGKASLARQPVKGASPIVLDVRSIEPLTLHMAEDSKIVYQALGRAAGLNVLFDPEYVPKRIQVDLNNLTVLEALGVLEELSNTFWKPVTHNTIFVAQDTRAKRQALSQQAVQIFYLKYVSQPNDLNDIQTALRNMLPAAKLYGVATQNAIMMRATPDELRLAEMLILGLDHARPEVIVDISVMEVSRDKLQKIGLSPPTSLTVNSGSSQTLSDIGKSSSYSISVGQAAVDFLLTDSDTKILQSPTLRALDGQKATLKLGERIPIATGSYTVGTGSSSAAAETQFQYVDVGVNVEMTPAIHGDRDVTLKLSVEVSAQSGTSTISGVSEPIISQQKSDQMIQLKDGEATLLAGFVKRQDSRSSSGWPGLGDIPIAKYFFTTQSHEVVNDELVFMVVPHVVRGLNSDANVDHPIDTGTDSGIRLRNTSLSAPDRAN